MNAPLKKSSIHKGQETVLAAPSEHDNDEILIGLGWDPAGINSKFEFDLDLACFLLYEDGKMRSEDDFVYYHNLEAFDGVVEHHGDDPDGRKSLHHHDEFITIRPADLPREIRSILILVSIYEGVKRNQRFGEVERSFVEVIRGDQCTEWHLDLQDSSTSGCTVMECGRIYLGDDGTWRFKPADQAFRGGLHLVIPNYGDFEGSHVEPTKQWAEKHRME